jgi:hypothetical protein
MTLCLSQKLYTALMRDTPAIGRVAILVSWEVFSPSTQ